MRYFDMPAKTITRSTRDAAMPGCARRIAEAIVKAFATGKSSIARDCQSCKMREFVKLEKQF